MQEDINSQICDPNQRPWPVWSMLFAQILSMKLSYRTL